MTYINLDTAFYTHPKVIAAGKDARDLYIGALMWSRANLTDGVIPVAVLHLLDPTMTDPEHAKELAETLRNTGLMRRKRGGNSSYFIPDFAAYQQTKDDVRKAREQAKERQRRWRDRRVSHSVSHAVSNATRAVKEEELKDLGLKEPVLRAREARYTCDRCAGLEFKTELKLAEHMHNVHDVEAS